MIVVNDAGAWAKVNKIFNSSIHATNEDVNVPWTSSVGVVTLLTIDTDLFSSGGVCLDAELLSSIIGMLNPERGLWIESHGVTFFELPEGTEEQMWSGVIRDFLKDSSRYNLVHPRMMVEERPYLFFSRRHTVKQAKPSEGVA